MSKDLQVRKFLRNPLVFADLVNTIVFDGKQVIKPEELQEMDSAKGAHLNNRKGNGKDLKKYRDLQKKCLVRKGKNAVYMIFSIEHQSEIHYAMPLRMLVYDALDYQEQFDTIRRKNESKESSPEKQTNRSKAEWLGRFDKKDRIIPVVTLTLYLGRKPWDGPTRLTEMMDLLPDESPHLLKYIQDWNIHLIEPNTMSDAQLMTFCTELREVCFFYQIHEQ